MLGSFVFFLNFMIVVSFVKALQMRAEYRQMSLKYSRDRYLDKAAKVLESH